jgi:CubicO group peptidase (beta-lactamase class C family)
MNDMETRVDETIDAAIAGKRIVGTAILIAVDGHTVYRGVKGQFDREAGIPMREDAIFRLASVTKPVVAATALALIERGKLSLDDTVARYLPDFRPKLRDGSTPDILIRHLLTHTSGLAYPSIEPGDPYVALDISGGLDQPGRGMQDNLSRLARALLYFKPGTAWRYGMSIDVLGAIIAKVDGGTLADAVAQYITRPLGMNDAAFHVTDKSRLAVPYGDHEGGAVRMGDPHTVPDGTIFSPSRILDPRSFQSGGAGMAGTVGDFLKFLEAIRIGGGTILKAETVAMATRNHIGNLAREEKDAGWRFGYLSAILADPVAAKTAQHLGTLQWGGAWGHSWFIDPAAKISVAAFTNTAMEGCNGPFAFELRDAVYR